MKIKVTTQPDRPSIGLAWQLPGAKYPESVYLLPGELNPVNYPHIASDCGRILSFWGDRLVLHESVCNLATNGQTGSFPTRADVLYCNTHKLLAILRTLHERQVRETVVDTDRLIGQVEAPIYSVAELARHANQKTPNEFGRTLRHFHAQLQGGERTFKDLLRDLARLINCAHLYAMGDEFYFNGRFPGGCGYNGGIILHRSSYGIHT